jgi:hypothetical protein
MPRPKQYDNDADRARAWRERRVSETRDALALRLREADDETLDRLVHMLPMPGLMRLSRALEWAEHPERTPERGGHRHGDRRRGPRGHEHPHHHRHHRRDPLAPHGRWDHEHSADEERERPHDADAKPER